MVRCFAFLVAALALMWPLHAAEVAPGDVARGTWRLPSRSIWVGEIFELDLAMRVRWDQFQNLDGEPDWKPGPLVVELFSPPVLEAQSADGRVNIVRTTRAMALAPGTLALGAPRQAMVLQTGTVAAGGMDIAVTKLFDVVGETAKIDVRPLPPAPEDFGGAIGRFTLESDIDKSTVRAGETVRWRLTMRGRGNWSMIRGVPSRLLSRDFDLVGVPEIEKSVSESPFVAEFSETVVILANKAGRYTLGPVEMSVFDPEIGRFIKVAAPPLSIAVAAAPPSETDRPKPLERSSEPSLPPALEGAGPVSKPLSAALQAGLFAAFAMAFCLLWLMLAVWRTWRDDPVIAKRRAHRRLSAALGAIEKASDKAETRQGLRQWQRQMIALHALPAAPVAADIAFDQEAAGLWQETEVWLYGRGGELAPDWPARARTYLQMTPPPPRRALAFLDRANLWPRLAPLLLVAFSVPAAANLADQQPDWHYHYNRAIALAQADTRPEARTDAAVEAAVAWVQAPRSARSAALWRQLATQAELPSSREGGLPGGTADDPAGPSWRLSAPEWQRLSVVSGLIMFFGAALSLLARYGHVGSRWWRRGGVLLAIGVGLVLVSTVAQQLQGPVSSPTALLIARSTTLYSVPVEDPVETGANILAPGTVAKANRSFLTWTQIRLKDGREGWVRASDLVMLWLPAAPAATKAD